MNSSFLKTSIGNGVFGREAWLYDVADSSMDRARALAGEGAVEGGLVLCRRQLKGRGRAERTWFSPAGCLMFSIILRPPRKASECRSLALIFAHSIARTLHKQTGADILLRWPNDLMHGHKKLGGVILEGDVSRHNIDFMILGAGVNLTVEEQDFPEELRGLAISLKEVTGRDFCAEALLPQVLVGLEDQYRRFLNKGSEPFIPVVRKSLSTLGRRVRVDSGKESVEGLAFGLSPSGGLMLKMVTGGIKEIISAEKVTYLE